MNITLIAAVGKNLELGKDNTLIWSIPEDLNFFRENTMGKTIVMGMNTLKSLPKLLPNRKHVVITRKNIELDSSIVVVHSIDELLSYIDSLDEEELFDEELFELLSFEDCSLFSFSCVGSSIFSSISIATLIEVLFPALSFT